MRPFLFIPPRKGVISSSATRPSAGARMGLWQLLVITWLLICTGNPLSAGPSSTEELYSGLRSEYQAAVSISDRQQKIDALRECARRLRQLTGKDTQGKIADRCLYLTAQCYHHLYDLTQNPDDFKLAVEYYRKLVEKHRSSSLADDAQYLLGILYMPDNPSQAYLEFKKVSIFFPRGDMNGKASEKLKELGNRLGCTSSGGASRKARISRPDVPPRSGAEGLPKCPGVAELRRVQHWSSEEYTRVVLYLSGEVPFEEQSTQGDPKQKRPARISVDLKNCVLGPRVGSRIHIKDVLLESIHAAQRDTTNVRISLEADTISKYRVFSLPDPFRVVIDIKGDKGRDDAPVIAASPGRDRGAEKSSLPSLARQLGLEVKRIVIDPGHGGKDKGAISPSGLYEKDIVLRIAKDLKNILERELKCEVVLTRSQDCFVPLEERTAVANVKKADLFISIHTNAHQDRNICGTETYFLNLSGDKESARVAAAENATSTKSISDLESLLHKIVLNTKVRESSQLANEVQRTIIKRLKEQRYEEVRDLGVKQAPFLVLLGAEMPGVLVETAFITNEREESRLRDKNFRASLARGIAEGIISYVQQIKGIARIGDRP